MIKFVILYNQEYSWASGETSITETTKVVGEKDPITMSIIKLYSFRGLHFIASKNKHHSRAGFMASTHDPKELIREARKEILNAK